MTDISESKLHQYGTFISFWWKVTAAIVGFFMLLSAGWVQFLGPGIQPAVQEFAGVTRLEETSRQNTSEIIDRLDFVEQYMPAPRVVDWNESAIRQIGTCTSDRCLYLLNGARTEYGESCGRPDQAIVFIRTSTGQSIQTDYRDFVPVELGREPISFTVDVTVPVHVPEGQHEFRTKIIYPTCPGSREPIPRWTPWFPLQVSNP